MHPDVDASAMRGLLEARRVTLREGDELGVDGKATVELDQTSVGRVSRIDALQAQQLALAAARQRRHELARIEGALVRLGDGSYGECLACGEDIAPRRLIADPAATQCIACAGRRPS